MSEIWHNGILGQKWGKRNGPPYPLRAGDHSASEKKAGWRKSLNKGSDNSDNTGKRKRSSGNSSDSSTETQGTIGSTSKNNKRRGGLTTGQKRALGVLAAAAVTYGVYKYAQMNPDVVKRGRELLASAINKFGSKPVPDANTDATDSNKAVDDYLDFLERLRAENKNTAENAAEGVKTVTEKASEAAESVAEKVSKATGASSKPGEIKWDLKETLDESLQNTNPLGGTTNCWACSISGILPDFQR